MLSTMPAPAELHAASVARGRATKRANARFNIFLPFFDWLFRSLSF